MRILHTSDWHLGRTLHGADLTPAFEAWCDHVVDLTRTEKIDAVLISGDVYDRSIPPIAMVDLLSDTLARLLDHAQVVLTSGNHDSPKRLGFGSRLFKDGLTIRTDARLAGEPIELRDDDAVGAVVYALPYLDPDIERHRLADDPERPLERSHNGVVAGALARVSTDIAKNEHPGIPKIALAHAFVVGGEESASERDLHIGGVDSIYSSLFRLGADGPGPLDYVALGHLHGAQKVGKDSDPLMRYSGSPVAFSFSEEHQKKSSVLLDFTKAGSPPSWKLIDAPVHRPLKTITDTLDNLTSGKYAEYTNHFLRIYVTDQERPSKMSARLNATFNHVLEAQHQTSINHVRSEQILATRTNPVDVLREFFEVSGGRELDSREASLVQETWDSLNGVEK